MHANRVNGELQELPADVSFLRLETEKPIARATFLAKRTDQELGTTLEPKKLPVEVGFFLRSSPLKAIESICSPSKSVLACYASQVSVRRSRLRKDPRMATGTVKWFNAQKGHGFIQPDDGGGDVFLHVSKIEKAGLDDVHEGQKVAYELVTDRKTGKAKAGNLKVL